MYMFVSADNNVVIAITWLSLSFVVVVVVVVLLRVLVDCHDVAASSPSCVRILNADVASSRNSVSGAQ